MVGRYTPRLDRGFAPGGILRGPFSGVTPRVSFLAQLDSGVLAAGNAGGAFGMARYAY